LAKVPYMVVVGEREAADRSVSLRLLRGEKSNAMPLAALVEKLKQEPIPA
jgi:threonyl-tRNA synthetase